MAATANPFIPCNFKPAPACVSNGRDDQPSQPRSSDETWFLMGDDPERTVRADRRRRTEGDPSQRERADAPERRDAPSSSSGGGGGGWQPAGGGFAGGDGGTGTTDQQPPPVNQQPQATSMPGALLGQLAGTEQSARPWCR